MTQFVWCNKTDQFRHASVCKKVSCNHLISHDEDDGFECHFINAEKRRVKKAERIEAKKDAEEARDYRTGAVREEEDDNG